MPPRPIPNRAEPPSWHPFCLQEDMNASVRAGALMSNLMPNLILFLTLLLMPPSGASRAAGDLPARPPSALIEHEGRKYRVETDPDLHRIRVYYDLDQKPYPSGLILVLKRANHLPRRIKLGLTGTMRDTVVYSGLVPSNIRISGGITFEIGKSIP